MTLLSTEYRGKMQTLEKLLETFHKNKDEVMSLARSMNARK